MKALYDAVQEKNLQFFYDYRAVNGCYIYGGRKAPFGIVNFPAEFAKLRKMIQNRERRIWEIAQGKPVPAAIDDSNTGEFAEVETNFRGRDPHHDARGRATDLHAARGLCHQPVRLGGRVPRAGRPGVDDLRRQGPDVGHDDAVLSHVPARAEARTTRS